MKKIIALSLVALSFHGFAADLKVPEKSQAILYLNAAKMFKSPDSKVMPGLPEGFKNGQLQWTVLTIDSLAGLFEEKPAVAPAIALAIGGEMDSKDVLTGLAQAAQTSQEPWKPLNDLPFPAYSIKLAESNLLGPATGLLKGLALNPCVGAVSKDVVAFAGNPATLTAQHKLFANQAAAGGFGAAVPDCRLCVKLTDVDKLVASVQAKAAKAGEPADPTLEIFKGVTTVRALLRDAEGDARSVRISLTCKDEAAAQGLELGLGMFTMMFQDKVQGLKITRKANTVALTGTIDPKAFVPPVQATP